MIDTYSVYRWNRKSTGEDYTGKRQMTKKQAIVADVICFCLYGATFAGALVIGGML